MAPQIGLEPTTLRLTANESADPPAGGWDQCFHDQVRGGWLAWSKFGCAMGAPKIPVRPSLLRCAGARVLCLISRIPKILVH